MTGPLTDEDFRTLARFRLELRQFLHFSEEAALAEGLTPQQYQALLAIRAAPGNALGIGQLAAALLLQPHSASGLVSRLEKLEMVERTASAEDARRSLVRLTGRALHLLSALAAAHRGELRRLRPLLTRLLAELN